MFFCHTTIILREGTMPPRDMTRAGGSHTPKSTQRAYACRQQGLTLGNIMCSNNNSSTSTNSQWQATSRQEACGSQWHAHNMLHRKVSLRGFSTALSRSRASWSEMLFGRAALSRTTRTRSRKKNSQPNPQPQRRRGPVPPRSCHYSNPEFPKRIF